MDNNTIQTSCRSFLIRRPYCRSCNTPPFPTTSFCCFARLTPGLELPSPNNKGPPLFSISPIAQSSRCISLQTPSWDTPADAHRPETPTTHDNNQSFTPASWPPHTDRTPSRQRSARSVCPSKQGSPSLAQSLIVHRHSCKNLHRQSLHDSQEAPSRTLPRVPVLLVEHPLFTRCSCVI